jgi:hypothetical protein
MSILGVLFFVVVWVGLTWWKQPESMGPTTPKEAAALAPVGDLAEGGSDVFRAIPSSATAVMDGEGALRSGSAP